MSCRRQSTLLRQPPRDLIEMRFVLWRDQAMLDEEHCKLQDRPVGVFLRADRVGQVVGDVGDGAELVEAISVKGTRSPLKFVWLLTSNRSTSPSKGLGTTR